MNRILISAVLLLTSSALNAGFHANDGDFRPNPPPYNDEGFENFPGGGDDGFHGIDLGDNGGSPINDPTVVPVPAAVWLFGSALLGLIAIGRRS